MLWTDTLLGKNFITTNGRFKNIEWIKVKSSVYVNRFGSKKYTYIMFHMHNKNTQENNPSMPSYPLMISLPNVITLYHPQIWLPHKQKPNSKHELSAKYKGKSIKHLGSWT